MQLGGREDCEVRDVWLMVWRKIDLLSFEKVSCLTRDLDVDGMSANIFRPAKNLRERSSIE